jgi:putative two-component system response regulator
MKKKQILIVEDERIVAEDIKTSLQRLGYSVPGTATSGEEAVKKAEDMQPDLVLMDIVLGGEMDGIEASTLIRSRFGIPVVYLTACSDQKTLKKAKITDAFGYIIKPYENKDLQTKVEVALYKRKMENTLKEKEKILRKNLMETVKALALAVEMRDIYIAGHQRKVSKLASNIAEEMGLPEEQVDGLRMAGQVHDIGTIQILREILMKPDHLSQFESYMVRMHPQFGYDILKAIEFPYPVAQIVLQHHERIDGSGYPAGLLGGNILPEARILAVADIVEAMSSPRPYRPALGIKTALEETSKDRGILYDPDAVDACLKLFHEKKFKLE